MNNSTLLARHFREVHFGGNWTESSLKEVLTDITHEEAIARVDSLNTIAALVYHMNYYVVAVLNVLEGRPLNSSDKLSFLHPPIENEDDWKSLLNKVWSDAEAFSSLLEVFPDSRLAEIFSEERYGTYYRNLLGVIEHTHYHLGQVVIIKKLLRSRG